MYLHIRETPPILMHSNITQKSRDSYDFDWVFGIGIKTVTFYDFFNSRVKFVLFDTDTQKFCNVLLHI